MNLRRRRYALGGLVAAAGIALAAAPPSAGGATSGAPTFDSGRILGGQGGGEPSMAVDLSKTASNGYLYVVSIGGWGSSPPKGDPPGSGPKVWHSYDGGKTWSAPVPIDANGQPSGEDTDITVADNGNVITTDLQITQAWVQVSTDHGKTFNAGTGTAPEDDRPWLTAHGNTVYVAYHDFAAEVPVVCTSTDGGQSFGPCNPTTITDPTIASQCAENTIPARPLSIDPTNGSLNFLFSCSTAAENLQHPPYGPLHDYYLAQSTDGGQSWTDYPVFLADTSGGKKPNFANIFSTLGIDSKGNFYAVFGGTPDDNDPAKNPYHIYLVTSTNHGKTWTKPVQVDPDAAGTHTEPHFVVTTPGNIDVVYYGTSATGEPNGYCGDTVSSQVSPSPCPDGFARFDNPHPSAPLLPPPPWYVYMTQSHNALDAHPTFTSSKVEPSVIHVGEICTNGIVCGSSDRSLLDFISVVADCHGLAHVTYAGNTPAEETADFNNGAANIHESNQTGGSTIAPPAACPAAKATPTATKAKTSTRGSSLPNTGALPLGSLALLSGVAVAVALTRRRAG